MVGLCQLSFAPLPTVTKQSLTRRQRLGGCALLFLWMRVRLSWAAYSRTCLCGSLQDKQAHGKTKTFKNTRLTARWCFVLRVLAFLLSPLTCWSQICRLSWICCRSTVIFVVVYHNDYLHDFQRTNTCLRILIRMFFFLFLLLFLGSYSWVH